LASVPLPPHRRSVLFDLDNPLHLAICTILDTTDRKGADYARDDDPWNNFRGTAAQFGMEIYEAGEFNCVQKLTRLKNLRANGRVPQNESVEDTYMDFAVYAVLTYAMYLDEITIPSEPHETTRIVDAPEGTDTGVTSMPPDPIPTGSPQAEREIPGSRCSAIKDSHQCEFFPGHRMGTTPEEPYSKHYNPLVGYWVSE